MDADAITVIAGTIVIITQLIKWAGLADKYGPISVIVLSIVGVAFWTWSKGAFGREVAWDFVVGTTAVASSAAGVFGFTRAVSTAITATKETVPPSGGAGSNRTVDAPSDKYGYGSYVNPRQKD